MGAIMRVLLTGASGFAGRRVHQALLRNKIEVRAAYRSIFDAEAGSQHTQSVKIGDIGPATDWREALSGITHVVHLAGMAHVLDATDRHQYEAYQRTNVEGTAALARGALVAGVRRFLFVSSARVHGDQSLTHAFTERDPPQPLDPYSESKWRAEAALAQLLAHGATQLVVLRPPLMYGPGVKANFLRLLRLTQRGLPVPLGAVRNRRSLLFVDNFADAVVTSLTHPSASGKTFLISDGEDLSTPDLLRCLASALNTPARIIGVPVGILKFAATLVGRTADLHRLCDNFAVDSSAIRRELNWSPPWTLRQGMDVTARWYLRQKEAG